MHESTTHRSLAVLFSLATLALFACTDTETVFVDRPLFDDPPAGASGFLGYGTEDAEAEKFPVCGNCHIGTQSEWEGTHHADAWATLQANSHAQELCEACHTVSENGNAAEGDAGWVATGDPRYHDVQCESCHGPGSGHLSNPEAYQPLASIKVDVDLTSGCGECHQGSHHGFVEDWANSRHGFEGSEFPRGREGCQDCHEGRRVLQIFGVNTDYIEKDEAENLPIVCVVCHDPHSNATNEHQLRFPIDVASIEENLCMKCHHRRAVPEVESDHGLEPHSPQGPLLLGEGVGWIPPNFDTNIVRGTHGSAQNEKLCATCHVHAREITDPVTGDFVLESHGHLFEPIPCLDEQGRPISNGTCDITERSFDACVECHGDETSALTAYLAATERIDDRVAQLAALLAQVPDTELDPADDVLTVAEGALFNQNLAEIRSSAVHNPFLTEALLLGSIKAVQDEYGLAAVMSATEIDRRMQEISK
ncbi:MAG: cytochrome c3 family protein [Gemmatimonadales bacterium]